MKNIYSLIFIIFIINFSFSQEREKDSLNLLLLNVKNDSLRKIEYNNILSSYRNRNSEIHYFFIQKALKLDQALVYALALEKTETRPRSLANLFLNIGDLYVEKEAFYIANNYYIKSLEKYKDIKSSEGIIKIYNNLGNSFTKWKKYNKAEYYLLMSNNKPTGTKVIVTIPII